MSRKSISRTIGVLIAIIAILGIVLGAVLYTKIYQSHWGIQTAYGLKLEQVGVGQITSIEWGLITRYSVVTKDFILYNIGTEAANVTLTMPLNTSRYEFSTTFENVTIPFEGSYNFSISLTDLAMESGIEYSGNFVFDIVDHFNVAYEPKAIFNSSQTEVSYKYATSTYLQYQGNSFDKVEYALGEVIQYSFQTKDIYADGGYVIAWQYSLYVEDNLGNIVATVKDHYTVSCNMSTGDVWTENLVFNAPLTEANYHMNLTYELADYLPPTPPEYSYGVNAYYGYSDIQVDHVYITGFSYPNESSTMRVVFKNMNTTLQQKCHYKLYIAQTGLVIGEADTPILNPLETWSTSTYSFTSPSAYGHYSVRIDTSEPAIPPEYSYVVTRVQDPSYPQLYIESDYVIVGFSCPNEASSLKFNVYNSGSGWCDVNIEAKILETGQILLSKTNVRINGYVRWQSGWINFVSPSEYGSYTIQIKIVVTNH